MNKIRRKCLLSWQIPSIGFGITFPLGLGLSYSNQDIRSGVQSVGLVIFSVLVTILQRRGYANGSYYTAKAFRSYQRYQNKDYLKYAIAGLLVNLSIVFFVVTSVSKIYTRSHPLNTTKHSLAEFKPSSNASKLPIWIDTDPACGQSATNDVDDCWADRRFKDRLIERLISHKTVSNDRHP